jgi:SAM-dependent methyltransferase
MRKWHCAARFDWREPVRFFNHHSGRADVMGKQDEIDYLARIGEVGAAHAQGKPFSDPYCGAMLSDLGGLFMLLPPPPARVLDLGCGTGWTSTFLAKRGYQVVGQDIAPDMIAIAEQNKARDALDQLQFLVSDYESLGFSDEFDAALFYDCLHHAEDPSAALTSVYRALKPGGILITLEPGRGHSKHEHTRKAVAAFGVTELDMPPSLIVRLARRIGFRQARIHPMPKTLAIVQYQLKDPFAVAGWISDCVRWFGIGWLALFRRRAFGGMVVLRK